MNRAFELVRAEWPLSLEQLSQREKLKDRLSEIRTVDHNGEFPSVEAADAAANELSQLGYRTSASNEDNHIELAASKESALDRDSVAAFLYEVLPVFDQHRGTYEGWGAPVTLRLQSKKFRTSHSGLIKSLSSSSRQSSRVVYRSMVNATPIGERENSVGSPATSESST